MWKYKQGTAVQVKATERWAHIVGFARTGDTDETMITVRTETGRMIDFFPNELVFEWNQ